MSTGDRGARPEGGHITVRYWASARAAAGVEEEYVETGESLSLAGVKALLSERHRDDRRLLDVLRTCSILLGDRPVSAADPEEIVVPVGACVEFLPPFAGG